MSADHDFASYLVLPVNLAVVDTTRKMCRARYSFIRGRLSHYLKSPSQLDSFCLTGSRGITPRNRDRSVTQTEDDVSKVALWL